VSESGYPQIAIFDHDGSIRRRIDCVPTTRPDVYLANEAIDAADGEAVVIALHREGLEGVQLFAELRASH
jgi:hypothetical protein